MLISFDKVYVNPAHIISVRDYEGVNEFLLSEGNAEARVDKYSLLKLSMANKVEEMIVLGTSEEIFSKVQLKGSKDLLNG